MKPSISEIKMQSEILNSTLPRNNEIKPILHVTVRHLGDCEAQIRSKLHSFHKMNIMVR